MRSELVGWVYGLTVVLILGGILLRAAPKGIHQKFLRFFFGILVLLAVFSPVLNLLGISDRAAAGYESLLFSLEQSLRPSEELADWQDASVRRREASMQEPLQVLVGEYGYDLLQAEMDWNEDGTEVRGIVLVIAKTTSADRGQPDPAGGNQGNAEGEETAGGGLTWHAGEISPVDEIRPIDPVGENEREKEEPEENEPGRTETEEKGNTETLQDLQAVLQSLFSLPESRIQLIVR